MSDRALVLGNIAANLRRGGGTGEDPSARLKSGPTHAETEAPWPRDLLVERFCAELSAVAGRVHRAPDARAASSAVVALCRARGVSRVLSWDPRAIELDGLPAAMTAAGITIDAGMVPRGEGRAARLAALEPLQVGITGALAGIAESGTIAVVSGPGRSRLASLLPPMHIAVLQASRLYPSLAAFFAAHAEIADEGSNLVLITGPSRTADIEMTLTRGVHGPGEVHVVLVD